MFVLSAYGQILNYLADCFTLAGDRSSSPLPEFVPNTLPEEPSYPPPTEPPKPQRNLRRRVTPSVESRPPTPPKELEPVEDEPPPPRKVS